MCERLRNKNAEDPELNTVGNESNVIAYGMKDLKVAISPRFIL